MLNVGKTDSNIRKPVPRGETKDDKVGVKCNMFFESSVNFKCNFFFLVFSGVLTASCTAAEAIVLPSFVSGSIVSTTGSSEIFSTISLASATCFFEGSFTLVVLISVVSFFNSVVDETIVIAASFVDLFVVTDVVDGGFFP